LVFDLREKNDTRPTMTVVTENYSYLRTNPSQDKGYDKKPSNTRSRGYKNIKS